MSSAGSQSKYFRKMVANRSLKKTHQWTQLFRSKALPLLVSGETPVVKFLLTGNRASWLRGLASVGIHIDVSEVHRESKISSHWGRSG